MSSKLKVLQVIPRLGYGGAETGCYDLAHYLAENKVGSFVVTSGGELIKYLNKKKVKLIRLPVQSKNPILMLINSIILSIVILIFNIDIVHARSRAPAWSCLIATRLTRRKFVTTFHGTYNFNNKIKKFYNSVMLRSDVVIAGSNFIFSHINEKYSDYVSGIKKFMVIFRGINTEYFHSTKINHRDEEKIIKQWGIKNDRPIILLPGRLTSWKGQELFIEALNRINEHYKFPFYAIILGSDQGRKIYKKKLESLVDRYRLHESLKFIEKCELMPIAYKVSRIVISASIEPEAFGRVSVEAQSMEKPIIASNIGGSIETIIDNKTGFLFENKNVEKLADKIVHVLNLDRQTLESMGTEARKHVLKKFEIEKMCFSTYTEYKKLFKKIN